MQSLSFGVKSHSEGANFEGGVIGDSDYVKSPKIVSNWMNELNALSGKLSEDVLSKKLFMNLKTKADIGRLVIGRSSNIRRRYQ